MTRKDYVALAAALHEAKPARETGWESALSQWQHDCHHIADVCGRDNPRFDVRRFLTACGVED